MNLVHQMPIVGTHGISIRYTSFILLILLKQKLHNTKGNVIFKHSSCGFNEQRDSVLLYDFLSLITPQHKQQTMAAAMLLC